MGPDELDRRTWRAVKRLGFSDAQIAYLLSSASSAGAPAPRRVVTEADVRAARLAAGVRATFKTVDTCGAEFAAHTPYHYSTYEDEDEVRPSRRPRVVILGSGPNRIGQGIEFDYCCVHASMALQAAGFETVMVNCNPETVSTDYDTSDRLYFEPLTAEDVDNVLEAEAAARFGSRRATGGGGHRQPRRPDAAQARPSPGAGAGARHEPGLDRPGRGPGAVERSCASAWGSPSLPGGIAVVGRRGPRGGASKVGYPVLVRPSYVLGGRAMEIVYDDEASGTRRRRAGRVARPARGAATAERPVLVDRFLEDAVEVDVDAVRDRTGEVVIAGVMEHVEEAGVHSGDSACALPPQTLVRHRDARPSTRTRGPSPMRSRSSGPLNVQYAVKDGAVYVLEANPRASRTVPFVAKATGVPWPWSRPG